MIGELLHLTRKVEELEDEITLLREFIGEVALEPWKDSNPESLLRTLAARAKAVLGESRQDDKVKTSTLTPSNDCEACKYVREQRESGDDTELWCERHYSDNSQHPDGFCHKCGSSSVCKHTSDECEVCERGRIEFIEPQFKCKACLVRASKVLRLESHVIAQDKIIAQFGNRNCPHCTKEHKCQPSCEAVAEYSNQSNGANDAG